MGDISVSDGRSDAHSGRRSGPLESPVTRQLGWAAVTWLLMLFLLLAGVGMWAFVPASAGGWVMATYDDLALRKAARR